MYACTGLSVQSSPRCRRQLNTVVQGSFTWRIVNKLLSACDSENLLIYDLIMWIMQGLQEDCAYSSVVQNIQYPTWCRRQEHVAFFRHELSLWQYHSWCTQFWKSRLQQAQFQTVNATVIRLFGNAALLIWSYRLSVRGDLQQVPTYSPE